MMSVSLSVKLIQGQIVKETYVTIGLAVFVLVSPILEIIDPFAFYPRKPH